MYCDDLGDFRKAIEFFQQGLAIAKEVGEKETEIIERLRFTFTPNCKREFVQRDQVSSLTVVYCLLLPLTIKWFHASFIYKNCSGQFLPAYFYSETCIKRTPSIERTVDEVPKFISLIYFK